MSAPPGFYRPPGSDLIGSSKKSSPGFLGYCKQLYADPFQWSFLKGFVVFAVGVWATRQIADELKTNPA